LLVGLLDDLLKSIFDIEVQVIIDIANTEFTGGSAEGLFYFENSLDRILRY
jgi:hypothetical protein